jgi:hypothetical protein
MAYHATRHPIPHQGRSDCEAIQRRERKDDSILASVDVFYNRYRTVYPVKHRACIDKRRSDVEVLSQPVAEPAEASVPPHGPPIINQQMGVYGSQNVLSNVRHSGSPSLDRDRFLRIPAQRIHG